MRVSAIQVASTHDVEENRQSLRSWVERAAQEGSELIVLPEASQRRFGTGGEPLISDAESIEGPYVSTMIALSRQFNVTISAGIFEISHEKGKAFNTTVLTKPSGSVASYRKIHLYDAFGFEESAGVVSGPVDDSNLLVRSRGGLRVGVMTCFDLRFPEMAGALLRRGATAIAIGAAWVEGPLKDEQWMTLLRARAVETTSFVIAAAQPGPNYCGRSCIVHPNGTVLAQADKSGSCMITADLNDDELQEVRLRMPVEQGRRLR